jgi:hypothetical protein
MIQPPAFIAFTGIDRAALLPGIRALSRRYPIEWGILLDPDQEDKPLFPDAATRAALMADRALRFAAHVCGEAARTIANDPLAATIDLAGFSRVQVNHGFHGSSATQADNVARFGRLHGVRTMLQCLDEFPDDARLDWLYDVSFGTGVRPSRWPVLPSDGPFCGYSGGIGPDTVAGIVAAIAAPEGVLYWIDMESGVRSDGLFDLVKCEAVCRAVFG